MMGPHPAMPARFLGRSVRAVGTVLGVLLLAAALAEVVLQVASLFARDRAGVGWRPGATYKVLCVGDSHTYGAGEPEQDSYPAQLQVFLDAQAPGRYSVLNLGVPGMNSAQVLTRLPVLVARFHPDMVVVWAGVNDAWNDADVVPASSGWRKVVDGIAMRSRLYRLVRVWLHDRRLERDTAPELARDGTRFVVESDRPMDSGSPQTLRWGGVIERIRGEPGPLTVDAGMEERAVADYTAMVEYARSAGVPIAFVMYPLDLGAYAAANRALKTVADATGVPLVDSQSSLLRVPPADRKWGWAAHPKRAIYGEIARDVGDRVVAVLPAL
jgi:lysophospholipase L1-like esterase